MAKFELGEGDEPGQREARALRQRQASDVIDRLKKGTVPFYPTEGLSDTLHNDFIFNIMQSLKSNIERIGNVINYCP